MSLKVEKVLRFHLLLLPSSYLTQLTSKVTSNILICCYVCYISAQVADFMSSVGNRLIGGKSTVAGIREFHCNWSPNHVTCRMALPIFVLLRVSSVRC